MAGGLPAQNQWAHALGLCRWQDCETEETRIRIFAMRNIARGEEITYDYGWQDFGLQQSFKWAIGKSKRWACLFASWQVLTSLNWHLRKRRCECGKEACRKCLDANSERLRRRGEKVTVDVEGELCDGTAMMYKPQSKNYEVLLADGATVDIDLESNPNPGRRSRTRTKVLLMS